MCITTECQQKVWSTNNKTTWASANDQADCNQTTCRSAAVCFLCNRDMPHRSRNSEGGLRVVLSRHWAEALEVPGAVKLRNGTKSVWQPGLFVHSVLHPLDKYLALTLRMLSTHAKPWRSFRNVRIMIKCFDWFLPWRYVCLSILASPLKFNPYLGELFKLVEHWFPKNETLVFT